ncbi:hypothetical protein RvY_12645 [Ramazzottius varieornatus]|uniref:G-protein coupled receptors family 1 profile domain-containing protein n=1 Tax=Ramazzottius varieornatus TaxID=947166 RepID=A0A1D1VK74_RAMVA|nr:hypothetical protein RvY_12645 [Ramazzottius varieornatus]
MVEMLEEEDATATAPSIPPVLLCTSSNSSTNLTADDIALEHIEHFLYGIVMPTLSFLGIIGNILNLVVLTRPNLMKIVTYTYFRAMAIADLGTMITVLIFVFELTGMKATTYLGSLFQAHVTLALLNAFVGSSVLTIVAVTFERWLSICHPLQAKNIQSPLRAKIIIACAWITSFILYLPYSFRKYVSECWDSVANEPVYSVVEDKHFTHSPGFEAYGWIREFILRIIPMVVLVALNIRIVFALRTVQSRRRRLRGGVNNTTPKQKPTVSNHSAARRCSEVSAGGITRGSSMRTSEKQTPAQKLEYRRLQEERRLVLLLIGIVVMFIICVTPAAILLCIPGADEDFTFGLKLFRAVANVLELTNYSLNFYVYVGCSSEFRMTFVSVFCRYCTGGKTTGMLMNGERASSVAPSAKTAVNRARANTMEMNNGLNYLHSGNTTPLLPVKKDSQQALHSLNKTETQSLLHGSLQML